MSGNAPLTLQRYKHMALKGWGLPVQTALRLDVGVVDRDGEQHHRIEHVRAWIEREIADEGKQCFLPLHFARVDVRLHVDDRPSESPRLCRRRHERTRKNHQRELASLGRLPDRRHPHDAHHLRPPPAEAG